MLSIVIVQSVIHLTVLVWMLLLAWQRRSWKVVTGAFLWLIAAVATSGAVLLPKMAGFSQGGLHWNWLGKGLGIAVTFAVLWAIPWLTKERAAAVLPRRYKPWVVGLFIGVVCSLPNLTVMVLEEGYPPTSIRTLETYLFQLTMPSLGEEFAIRGVLLAMIDYYLPREWQARGVVFGWGTLMMALYFVLQHTVQYDPAAMGLYWGHTVFDTIDLVFATTGLVLVRELTGSIWPAMITHSVVNLSPFVLTAVIQGGAA